MSDNDLKAVRRAARQRVTATANFRTAVVDAHRAGESLRRIAEAAGLSHVRVLNIVREAGDRDG